MCYICLKIVACCLCILEKVLKFLNKHAYIQVAIRGTWFWTSAKKAANLLVRNCLRFSSLYAIGTIISALGWIFTLVSTCVFGYACLREMYPEVDPFLPVILYGAIGYTIGRLMMNIFALSVDTIMQCYIAVEEILSGADADTNTDYIPDEFSELFKGLASDKDEGRKCCFGRC